jgi:hypothetical protein
MAVTLRPGLALDSLRRSLMMSNMATRRAIAAIGKSIVGLLGEECPKAEFPSATFKLCQPSAFRRPKGLRFGISLCLYRVSFDTAQRNPPTRVTASAEPRQRPSLPLNLHFLLSSWATIPERQYDLRGWAMCVLDENPVFSAGLLNRFAGGTSEVFGQQENVEVVPANLDIEQMKAVSELVQIRQQPSIAYVARPVAIQNLSG